MAESTAAKDFSAGSETRAAIPGIRRTAVALFFPAAVTFEQWRGEAEELLRQHRDLLFQVGDAFIYGQAKFGELAASVVGMYSVETVQRAIRVCTAIPPQRRLEGLGFSMHQAVEKLPPHEQDELLRLAKKQDWTREAMRAAVTEKRKAREQREQPEQPSATVTPISAARRPTAHPVVQEPAATPTVAGQEVAPVPQINGSAGSGQPTDGAVEQLFDDGAGEDEDSDYRTGDLVELIRPFDLPEMSADDAVAMLNALAPNLPPNIGGAINSLVDEREKLLKVLKSARAACELGMVTPGLRDAVKLLEA